jgi:histone acetyltransferase (RNA polymerase elongator complex component)
MSAPASVSRSVEIPESLVVEKVASTDYRKMERMLRNWKDSCDSIAEKKSSTKTDRMILASAKQISEMVRRTIIAKKCDDLFLCKDAKYGTVLAIATTKKARYHLMGRERESFLEIEGLVSNPANLAISIHTDRIRGAGSALIERIKQVAKEKLCLGTLVISLASAERFYRKMGFEEARLEGVSYTAMVSFRDDIVLEKSA